MTKIRIGKCRYCGEKGFLVETVYGEVHIRCYFEAEKKYRLLKAFGHV